QRLPRHSGPHRIACIALYRALLLQCQNVPLPNDIPRSGSVNPLVWQVRKGFRRHVSQTSPARIREALTVGYNAHKLFTAAAKGSQAATTQIHSLLRLQEANREISRAQPRPVRRERPRVWPVEGGMKIEDIRPRPQHELGGTGRRKVPILASVSKKIAFLRFGGKQSPFLSRILRDWVNREQAWRGTLERATEMNELGAAESEWEGIVSQVAGEPGFKSDKNDWTQTGRQVAAEVHRKLKASNEKAKQKVATMVKIVEEEKALYEEERIERRRDKNKKRKEKR
ncbi:hypothetical protein B0O99DRAFT_486030, partial [Bisporella sp. PMI_857]